MDNKEFHEFMQKQIKALKKEIKKRCDKNVLEWINDFAKEFRLKYEYKKRRTK